MAHTIFYLSIAALSPFYLIFLLSIIRDIMRGRYADGSDDKPGKPTPPTKKFIPIITSVVMAHWITVENNPVTPLKPLSIPGSGGSLIQSLSVN